MEKFNSFSIAGFIVKDADVKQFTKATKASFGISCNKQIKTHLFFVKLNHQPIFLYFQLVSCQKWFVCFPFYSLFP